MKAHDDQITSKTGYRVHMPDDDGYIAWSTRENATWQTLMERQLALVEGRVCREYLDGLERLALPRDRVPQLADIDRVLKDATGWETAQVPALIPFDTFFELLAARRFPVATFIRSPRKWTTSRNPTSSTRSSATVRCSPTRPSPSSPPPMADWG
ncbi:phenylalanine-4-hydroxylase [Halomonas elongata]|uniref:Phenylalanine-4-hydroxylase n=1 Tax=Halomonas elongata TaxID=2746 RepID=A0A1B8P3J4_HALEL|nr:phenylalanine-4-hydroxylase [Halomonas elongata]